MKTITIKERPDLKTSDILNLCRDKFPAWSYYSDAELDKDFPAPKEATERAFLSSQEPDSATLGLSVNQTEAKGHMEGITIRERMLLELAYFKETGQHLDVKGVTFCSGSRRSDSSVIGTLWNDGQFGVFWYDLTASLSSSGIRSAVSPDTSSALTPELNDAIRTVKDAGYVVYKPT